MQIMITVVYPYILEMETEHESNFYCRIKAILIGNFWIRNVYNFEYLCVPK